MKETAITMDNQEIILARLGEYCAMTRLKQGIRQCEVAKEIGCSTQNLSRFENGGNNNALLLYWYIKHGLLETLKNWGEI